MQIADGDATITPAAAGRGKKGNARFAAIIQFMGVPQVVFYRITGLAGWTR
jgi:hypothetical protein